MAKHKFLEANEKIAQGVVDGYKKIETGVVGGFQKVSDAFVDQFLTREGETVEQAKARLQAEEEARRSGHKTEK